MAASGHLSTVIRVYDHAGNEIETHEHLAISKWGEFILV
jgi:hypothetical protein